MRAVATLETSLETLAGGAESSRYSDDAILRFNEGLIGFSDCKTFVLLESEGIAPFRRLQCTERDDVGFLVLDTAYLTKEFLSLVPERDWESIGLTDSAARLAFVICIIGPTPAESTGNLQAPLIINYANMTGRQVILGDTEFSSRHPLV
jgi:flagellar assembly factor FliW